MKPVKAHNKIFYVSVKTSTEVEGFSLSSILLTIRMFILSYVNTGKKYCFYELTFPSIKKRKTLCHGSYFENNSQ